MTRLRATLLTPLLLALLVAGATFSEAEVQPAEVAAGEEIVPGFYIVVFNPSVDTDAGIADLQRLQPFTPAATYRYALRGFAAGLPDAAVQQIRRNPNVQSVVPAHVLRAQPQTLPTGVDRVQADQNATAAIDGDGPDLEVDIAILDTGVDIDHPELRVAGGIRFVGVLIPGEPGPPFLSCGDGSGSFDDDNGHGTHVAGTAAARDNGTGVVGVAPGARIWSIKVLDGGGAGYDPCIIAGIDWLTGRRLEFNDGAGDGDPGINVAVANMSFGGVTSTPASSDPFCTAIDGSIAAGVVQTIAAGNDSIDANSFTPAHCAAAITVSAIADLDGQPGGLASPTCGDVDDTFADFSNFGSVVDIAAPGVCILSTYFGGQYLYASGTSMAAPHVAGAAALLKVANPGLAPKGVRSALRWSAFPQASGCGFSGDPDGFHEPLLNVGPICPSTPPPVSGGDTVGIWRDGTWHLNAETDGSAAERMFAYGMPGDAVFVGDWDCDGIDTVGIWRDGYWHLNNQNDSSAPELVFSYGLAGDIKVVGDWNGDGCDTVGIWRSGYWHLNNQNDNSPAEFIFSYGLSSDSFVVGDWDCNGTDTVGIWREGYWHLNNQNNSSPAEAIVPFGLAADVKLVGDWDGDGCDTTGVYRDGYWRLKNSHIGTQADLVFPYGLPTDVQVRGRWGINP